MKDLAIHKGSKVNTTLNLELSYEKNEGVPRVLMEDHYVSTKAVIITSEEGVNNFVEDAGILDKIDQYHFEDSALFMDGIKEHIINIYKYKLLGGSSYIDLPKEYKNSNKRLINIKNNDNMCFKYCFIANKYPVLFGKNRVSKNIRHMKMMLISVELLFHLH